jgi:hypothetical protein
MREMLPGTRDDMRSVAKDLCTAINHAVRSGCTPTELVDLLRTAANTIEAEQARRRRASPRSGSNTIRRPPRRKTPPGRTAGSCVCSRCGASATATRTHRPCRLPSWRSGSSSEPTPERPGPRSPLHWLA